MTIYLKQMSPNNGFEELEPIANAKFGFSVSGGKLTSGSNSVAIASMPYISSGEAYTYADHGENGQSLFGTGNNVNFGYSVGYVKGDFNQDGYNDLIIGDPGTNNNNGAAYIYSNNQLILIVKGASSDNAGSSVDAAGDFNNDGIPDIIIGAPNSRNSLYSNTGVGISYVIFGDNTKYKSPNTLPVTIDLSSASVFQSHGSSIPQVLKLIGYNAVNSGYSVGAAGDTNGDGIADIIIGEPGYSNNLGRVFIVFGVQRIPMNPGGTIAQIILVGSQPVGFTIQYKCIDGNRGDKYFGYSVGGLGNINGDTFLDRPLDDIIIGAPYTNSRSGLNNGKAYILFGNPAFYNRAYTPVKITLDGAPTNSFSGWSVSGAGDVNGDGLPDIIIGAPFQNSVNNAGLAYIIYGTKCPNDINLASLANYQGFTCTGSAGDNTGYSVSGIGNINGDSNSATGLPLDDIVIGAPNTNSNAGAAYTVYGFSQSTTTPSIGTTSITTSGVYKATGSNTNYVINSPASLTIEERKCDNNHNTYKFMPQVNKYNLYKHVSDSTALTSEIKTTITTFNVNSDVIDLTSYSNIHSIGQLSITTNLVISDDINNVYYNYYYDFNGTSATIITLEDGQIIELFDVVPEDMSSSNFIFANFPVAPAQSPTNQPPSYIANDDSSGSSSDVGIIAGAIIGGVVALGCTGYIMYKFFYACCSSHSSASYSPANNLELVGGTQELHI